MTPKHAARVGFGVITLAGLLAGGGGGGGVQPATQPSRPQRLCRADRTLGRAALADAGPAALRWFR
jgi:hypothetical protein